MSKIIFLEVTISDAVDWISSLMNGDNESSINKNKSIKDDLETPRSSISRQRRSDKCYTF